MSSSSTTITLEHPHIFLGDQLCYLHCNKCDTVLAVSVPSTSLFKTVTVRCGQCTNLLPLNVCRLKVASQSQYNLMNMIQSPSPNFFINKGSTFEETSNFQVPYKTITSVINRTPEKRQRVPSAYNRFIKDEIQRIKAGNPDISHREAFSAAAKNWAHFPHIQFGMIPDHSTKAVMCQQTSGNDSSFQFP